MKPLDEKKIAGRFNKAATTYDNVAILQQRVGSTLLKRLEYIYFQPQTILDLGCGTGYFESFLRKLYPRAKIIGLDKANQMLVQAQDKQSEQDPSKTYWVGGASERLPFKNRSFDFVFSNLMLHWSSDLSKSFSELRRVLKPGGLLLFTMVGPDTLRELRWSWKKVDDNVHVHEFMDLHDVGDILAYLAFLDSVVDIEYYTLAYSEIKSLMKELKQLGVQNLSLARHRGLTSKGALKKLIAAYELFRDSNGMLPSTWEIIYGHAWTSKNLSEELSVINEIEIPLHQLKKRNKVED